MRFFHPIGINAFELLYFTISRLQGPKDKRQEVGSLPGGECATILRRNQPTTLITKAQCPVTAVYVGQQNQPALIQSAIYRPLTHFEVENNEVPCLWKA